MKRSLVGLGACALALALAPSASAQQEFVRGEVVVKYADGASAAQKTSAARSAGVGRTVSRVRGVGAQVVRVDGGTQAAVRKLNRAPGVEFAEPNYVYHSQAIPNDPRFGELYGLNNTGQTGGTQDADIDAPEGWDVLGLSAFPGGGGAKVGIVDTGIQQSHSEFGGGRIAN